MDVRFCGEPLTPGELALIVTLVKQYGCLSRNELALTVCELLDWRRSNGRLKAIECRALLETLQAGGLIGLPRLRPGRPRGAATPVRASPDPQPASFTVPLAQLQPIRLERVETSAHLPRRFRRYAGQ